jgi:hypothetical protein
VTTLPPKRFNDIRKPSRDRTVLRLAAGILSQSSSDKSIFKTKAKEKQKGRHAMAKPGLGYLPKQNPCAQCGKLIAFPDWIEASSGRTSYLWHCRACDYRFEAIAYFEETAIESEPLAA